VITGAHAIIYSTDAEADRAFLRDVLGFPNVDAGDGWLIFGLPPAEVAIHPGDENDRHELYLMTGNVEALVASLKEQGITASAIADRGWGLLTQVTLPGGGKLGVYQPRHASPPGRAAAPKRAGATRSARKRPTRPSVRRKTARGRSGR
jgi:catechol 2,3-dioxygenase-like lactoylglutathione lyase family enzyme